MSRISEKYRILYLREKKRIYILRRVSFLSLALLLIAAIISLLFIYYRPIETVTTSSDFTPITTFAPIITTPNSEKVTILIYHTHNDEAYYKGNKNYIETDKGRSFDDMYNVIAVGKVLKEELEKKGFSIIHDTSDNVSNGFNDAYDTSYNNVKKYFGQADVFIDLHRDAYTAGNGTNYLKKDFDEYAYIRFVVANGTQYTQKPNFDENYELAKKVTKKLNDIKPGICKDVLKKEARLNQHISKKCLLVEIGNEKNDIEQVKNSAKILAEAIYNVLLIV